MSDIRVALLTSHNLSKWNSSTSAGELGPYGLEYLRKAGHHISWSDLAHSSSLTLPGAKRLRARVEGKPHLRGLSNALLSRDVIMGSDVLLSLFEDQGMAAATLARLSLRPYSDTPHVMVVCWLAETCATLSEKNKCRTARALEAVSKLIVFSENQVGILERQLEVPRSKIEVVSFGVSAPFFDIALPETSSETESFFLAVGQDRARDYQTLFRAARDVPYHIKVVCSPKNVKGLETPPNIAVLTGVSHYEYRDLLRRSLAVVTPTIAPAYPSGQTVMLEAMAMGKANIVTDSQAMRSYIEPFFTGITYPARDARALAQAINHVAENPELRMTMGANSKAVATEKFTHEHMWAEILPILNSVRETRKTGRRTADD